MAARSGSESFSITVDDGGSLLRVAAALGRAGEEFRRGANREMRRAGEPAVNAAHARARAILPHAGGLGGRVSRATITVTVSETGDTVRLTIAVHGSSPSIDRGRVRHPVYGHRDRWVWQNVPPGWFTVPMHDTEQDMRRRLLVVAAQTVETIRRAA